MEQNEPSVLSLSKRLAAFEASPCGVSVKNVMSPDVWGAILLHMVFQDLWKKVD